MAVWIVVAGFWGAMAGTAIMLAGMTLMYFAPVQSQSFRRRLKLNVLGMRLLFTSVSAMVIGVLIGAIQLLTEVSSG